MPDYASLGISASLSVVDLDKTLSHQIQLRMGSRQKEDADRVNTQLENGRTLPERPCAVDNSKVGILQFVGDDGDMALLLVKAGDTVEEKHQVDPALQSDDYTEGDGLPATDTGLLTTTAYPSSPEAQASMQDDVLNSDHVGTSTSASRITRQRTSERKVISNQGRNGGASNSKANGKLAQGLGTRKGSFNAEPNLVAKPAGSPVSLSLKVDCSKMIKRKDLETIKGKDLKLELFLNGELVDVRYETMRSNGPLMSRNGVVRFSGTRFHRQSEKPWIYIPASIARSSNDIRDQRWANIGNAFQQEAISRGMDNSHQRPLSADYMLALSRLHLPESINVEDYAVMDVIITAGSGKKFGPQSQYISEPTRLKDRAFKGSAPLVEDLESAAPIQGGKIPSIYEDPDLLGVQSPYPNQLFGNTTRVNDPPSPHTPEPGYKRRSQNYINIIEATPIRQRLLKYENTRGHAKGARTVRQRLGDMVKMSPKKQEEALVWIKDVVDDETLQVIKQALEIDVPRTPSPKRKKVRFSLQDNGPGEDQEEGGEWEDFAGMFDSRDATMVNAEEGYMESTAPLSTSASLMSYPTYPTNISFETPTLAQPAAQTLPHTPTKRTLASALANSPISVPVKRRTPQRRKTRSATEAEVITLSDANETPLPAPALATAPPSSASAEKQRNIPGANRSNARWEPNEKTVDEALESFQVPESCVGTTVTYAEGKTQRQIIKSRGGEFHESEFVVGIRFIVL